MTDVERPPVESEHSRQLQLDIVTELERSCETFAQDNAYSSTQRTALLNVVKRVHERSVAMRLTLEQSFQDFKDALLQHCVERVSLTVETRSPDHDVEAPPGIPPLQNAVTDEEHTAALQVGQLSADQHGQAAETRRAEEEAEALRLAEEMAARTMQEVSATAVATETIESAPTPKEAALMARIAELEALLAGKASASPAA